MTFRECNDCGQLEHVDTLHKGRCPPCRRKYDTARRAFYRDQLGPPAPARDMSWILEAACRGMSSEVFYPERGQDTHQAKMICMGCAVRVECLTFALETGEKFGIFGGTSERQRREMRRRIATQHVQARKIAEAFRPAKPEQPPPPPAPPVPAAVNGHGTANRYMRYGCRCDACRLAKAAYNRRRQPVDPICDHCGQPKKYDRAGRLYCFTCRSINSAARRKATA
jgi:WhiB family redox-sensing transcriptional regulator